MAPDRTRSERRASVAVGVMGTGVLVTVLLPLLLISAYNHAYADDWHYGVWAHLALEQTGNVGVAIVTALEQVGKAWFDWQGTYSAIFLMAIEPSVFGEQCYVIAAPLVMALLVAGTLFFSHVVLVELMGADRGSWIGLSCLVVAVQLLLQSSPVEGIFWFNSAIYYTGYHAAALALIGCVLRVCDPRRTRRPVCAMVASCVLAAFVAGGNFVTALVAAEVMVAILAVLIYQGRRCASDVLPAFAIMVLGLALSLAAPGNEVRQQTQFPDDGLGVTQTILQSSIAAFQYLQQWSSVLVVILAAASVPVAVRACERVAARGWTFRWPALVVAGSIALFATSFTPTFWAQGTVGPGRVQNCRFALFVVLVVVDVFWVCGWLAARRRAVGLGAARGRVVSGVSLAWATALAVVVLGCVVGSMAADKDLGEELSSVSAARSLASGQAAAYDEQVWERLDYIESSDEDSLRVPYYTDVPHVLLMGDIRDNMDNYINYRLCQWYGKKSIVGYHATTAARTGTAVSDAS